MPTFLSSDCSGGKSQSGNLCVLKPLLLQFILNYNNTLYIYYTKYSKGITHFIVCNNQKQVLVKHFYVVRQSNCKLRFTPSVDTLFPPSNYDYFHKRKLRTYEQCVHGLIFLSNLAIKYRSGPQEKDYIFSNNYGNRVVALLQRHTINKTLTTRPTPPTKIFTAICIFTIRQIRFGIPMVIRGRTNPPPLFGFN